MSAFAGKARSAAGENGEGFPIPPEDTHEARLVALVDLGTHEESFQGADPKPKRKALLAWELVDALIPGTRRNFVIAREYTLSFHESSGLRQLAEALLGRRFGEGEDVDYSKLLGAPCLVTVAHKKGTTSTYAKIESVGPMPKSQRANVHKPSYPLFTYSLDAGQGLDVIPDWLPYLFGKPVADKIAACQELTNAAGHVRGSQARQPAHAGAGREPWDGEDADADGAGVSNSEIPW